MQLLKPTMSEKLHNYSKFFCLPPNGISSPFGKTERTALQNLEKKGIIYYESNRHCP